MMFQLWNKCTLIAVPSVIGNQNCSNGTTKFAACVRNCRVELISTNNEIVDQPAFGVNEKCWKFTMYNSEKWLLEIRDTTELKNNSKIVEFLSLTCTVCKKLLAKTGSCDTGSLKLGTTSRHVSILLFSKTSRDFCQSNGSLSKEQKCRNFFLFTGCLTWKAAHCEIDQI